MQSTTSSSEARSLISDLPSDIRKRLAEGGPVGVGAVGPRYRMVALDLDGTLLGPDHLVSDASSEYLRGMHERGFVVCIATGRSPASTYDIIDRLDLKLTKNSATSGFPLVCLNGARGVLVRPSKERSGLPPIADPADDSAPVVKPDVAELFHRPVPRDVTVKALRLAKGMGLVANYYLGDEIHAQAKTDAHRTFTRNYTELTGTKISHCNDDYSAAMNEGLPSKLVIFCESGRIDGVYGALSDALDGDAHVVRGSPPWFVEVLNGDVSKGGGLELMCRSLGVGLDETIALGDGDNDLEFLKVAGRGIAMKNGRDKVKAVADEVTEWSNAEDGVIKTLQRMEEDGLLHFPKEA